VFYLNVSPSFLIERTFQKKDSLVYWESGMDVRIVARYFRQLYQISAPHEAEFQKMKEMYHFEVINGKRSARKRSPWICRKGGSDFKIFEARSWQLKKRATHPANGMIRNPPAFLLARELLPCVGRSRHHHPLSGQRGGCPGCVRQQPFGQGQRGSIVRQKEPPRMAGH
jgi:hypothetical protein